MKPRIEKLISEALDRSTVPPVCALASCRKQFIRVRNWQEYCSERCSDKAKRARREAKVKRAIGLMEKVEKVEKVEGNNCGD